ncbi:MAG: hypothetical protein QM817_34185 [Archangium sp.]
MRRLCVVAMVLSGCIEMIPAADAGGSMDSGAVVDAGVADAGVDAGLRDAGVDAGVDAGTDAGMSTDAGSDAGVDAGMSTDAGRDGGIDAGFDAGTDAGMSTDAGRDAGVDAGTDAGMSVDAGRDAGVDAGIDAGPTAACTTGSACGSGICLTDAGDCFNCLADSECGFGRLCGTGICEPACMNTTQCGVGRECCSGRCVDLQRDPGHCGMCTLGCNADSFCARGSCHDTRLSELCAMPEIVVMLDGIIDDDDAGHSIADVVTLQCAPNVTSRAVGQSDAGLLRVSDGEPIALGEMLVMGGGSFRQRGVAWLESTGNAELFDTSTVTDAIYSLRDGGVVSSIPFAMLSPTHDRVVIQLVRAPSGTLVLNAAGFTGAGTQAAAHYFVNVLAPTHATLMTRWYVLDWNDTDSSGAPSAGDTFTVIASGP